VGALAVSWAAKDIVANFFGGLMIFINRPFARGEWIRSPNKNFEGVVEKIGWYMTQIRTFDRRPMFVPNQLFIDAILENPGRMYNRRIKFDLGIRYDDMAVLQAVREGIERMLKAHADIDHSQTLMVHFVEYGPYSLNINIYCFCRTTNWAEYRRVQEDVLLRVGQIVTDLGAEIAFPTQTLHLDPGLSPQSSQ
jgi:MscS family membrane protein